jgi:hypothetical protein
MPGGAGQVRLHHPPFNLNYKEQLEAPQPASLSCVRNLAVQAL